MYLHVLDSTKTTTLLFRRFGGISDACTKPRHKLQRSRELLLPVEELQLRLKERVG